MLILKNISKKYESSKRYVLKNINLNIKNKGLVCILGESGSGKSTLLNLISGIDEPTTGEIYIDRTNIKILKKENSLYQLYIGMIFQNYNLINNLNVEDNIKLLDSFKTDTLLKKMNLKNKTKEKISKLSGGQQQRIAIARTLYKDKKIILCDEPTGALDQVNSENIMKILKKIAKNKLVIVVTHNEKLAYSYANRVIRLQDGKIIEDSSPEEIEEGKRLYQPTKNKVSIKQILKQVILNIRTQKKKTIFKMISMIISLISLLLILCISNGFNTSIKESEKEELATMPIYISETSTNIKSDFNNLFKDDVYDKNYIYSKDINHKNEINNDLLNKLRNIGNIKNIITNISINNMYLSTYDKDITEDINMICGDIPKNKGDLLLIIKDNNSIDSNILKSIKIKDDKIELKSLINYRINYKYHISGIARFKESSPMYDNTGLYTFNSNYKETPLEIYIYPSSYNNKVQILNNLNNIKDLEYLDYSDTVISVSKTIVTSISIVLSIFSIISILISGLMNYILTFISIEESIKNIGIFIVNGTKRNIIKLIYFIENITISVFSIFISILIILIFSIPINNLLKNIIEFENILLISKSIIIWISLISLTITIISTYFPLKKINKLKLVDILKYN